MGFLLIFISGICQGTFGIGYKKYSPFKWEAFWMLYSFLCASVATIAALIFKPDLFLAYSQLSASAILIPIGCGVLWGFSAIGFSKGIDLIGMSLVYGLSMGISTIVGSVVPIIMNGDRPSILMITGLLVTIIGIIIITKAGVMREKNSTRSKFGLLLALLSGLGSGAMNIGFSAAQPIAQFYPQNALYAALSSGQWLLVLIGGCMTDVIICAFMMFKANSQSSLFAKGSLRRLFILIFVSMIWYSALIIYGWSTKYLGKNATGIGWILFNTLALAISNGVGIKLGEWNDKSARKILYIGNAVLMISWIILAKTI